MRAKGITALVAAIILVAGIIIGGVGFAMNRDVPSWEHFEQFTKTFDADKSEISLSLSVSKVNVIRGDDDSIKFTYYDNERNYYSFDENGGKLNIERNEFGKKRWYEYITIWSDYEKYTGTLQIPQSFSGKLYVKTTTGDIRIESVDFADTVEISATTGAVSVYNVAAKSLIATATTGSVNAEDVRSEGEMQLAATTGGVKLKNVTSAGDIRISMKTGGLRAENITATAIDADSTTGSIKLTDIKTTDCKVKASTGSIMAEGIDAEKSLSFETSTGSIRAKLCGAESEYSVMTSVSSAGSSNVGATEQGRPRSLYLKTSVGGINVSFDD